MRVNLTCLFSSLAFLAAAPAMTAPALAADVCRDIRLQCDGFEPNWQFTLGLDGEGDQVVRFIDPENPNWQTEPLIVEACALQVSASEIHITSPEPLALDARVVSETCVEPNEEVRPYAVEATFNQGALTTDPNRVSGTGCCKLAP